MTGVTAAPREPRCREPRCRGPDAGASEAAADGGKGDVVEDFQRLRSALREKLRSSLKPQYSTARLDASPLTHRDVALHRCPQDVLPGSKQLQYPKHQVAELHTALPDAHLQQAASLKERLRTIQSVSTESILEGAQVISVLLYLGFQWEFVSCLVRIMTGHEVTGAAA